MTNEEHITQLVEEMLEESIIVMKAGIKKAITCGALDIEGWSMKTQPMVIPKVILLALLGKEIDSYRPRNTGNSLIRKVNREVRNLRCFI